MVTDVDRGALLELIASGAQVVDVLPEAEFNNSHIPGAINLPLKQLDRAASSVLRRDKPVVVY